MDVGVRVPAVAPRRDFQLGIGRPKRVDAPIPPSFVARGAQRPLSLTCLGGRRRAGDIRSRPIAAKRGREAPALRGWRRSGSLASGRQHHRDIANHSALLSQCPLDRAAITLHRLVSLCRTPRHIPLAGRGLVTRTRLWIWLDGALGGRSQLLRFHRVTELEGEPRCISGRSVHFGDQALWDPRKTCTAPVINPKLTMHAPTC
ncbi:hypothetical protein ACVIGA_000595 [Bradyrhizobium sp. USDA 3240]